MSDGDSAGPGRAGGSDGSGGFEVSDGSAVQGTNDRLTRKSQPPPRAAPWERRRNLGRRPVDPDDFSAGEFNTGEFSTGDYAGERPPDPPSDSVSVADLVARVGGRAAAGSRSRTSRHRAADETGDSAGHRQPADPVTTAIPAALPSEIPDLTATARRRQAEARPAGKSGTGSDHPPARTRHHPVMIVGRSTVALISLLALVLTGAAWQWSTSTNNRFNFISALDPNSRDIVDPNAQFGDENFLIVGVDSRSGENADMGAGTTADAGGTRSDTVMLVNIPASRKRVVAVSFPRDLAIKPTLCDAWDSSTGKYGPVYDETTGAYGPKQVYTETKLNSAYAFGGPKCLVKVIQRLSGLSINRFMAIDFAGFSKMVDAVGGVEVCSTTALQDYELGEVLPTAGRQMVDGRTALNYVRARQVTTELNGDYGRIKRQQRFLSSLLRSLISGEVFFSLRRLNEVVNTFINDSAVDNVQTKDLVDLGQSLQGIAAGRITFFTVPTGETDSEGNETLRSDDNRALFDAIINDDPLPGENNENQTTVPTTPTRTSSSAPRTTTTTTTPTTQPAPDPLREVVEAVTTQPKSVTVHVSNATGRSGLAAQAADELQHYGFRVLTPDDYPSAMQATTVFFSPGNEQAAATVASALSNPQIERVSGMGDIVQVVLGPDFSAVSSPSPTGSSVKVLVSRNGTGAPTRLPPDLSVTNAADVSCE